MINFLLSFCIILSITGISLTQDKKAFINGKIYTVNKKQPIVETVVISGNKIIYAGTNREAEKMIDSLTEIIDLKGKLMLPGFTDGHLHFISGGTYLLGINLRPAKSVEKFREILKEYLKTNNKGWITGGEWDHEAWDVKELPAKEIIDDITKDVPVFVTRFDGHMGLANSLALKIAGITKDTPSPDGGLIVKDPETGEPTGILKDNAMSLVYEHIPQDSEEQVYKKGLKALEEARKLGVTSVQDITFFPDLKAFEQIEKDGKLTCRIYTRFPINEYKKVTDLRKNFTSDKIKLGSLKAYADGSLGSMSAWFWEPYKQDTTTTGLASEIVINGSLKEWAFDADKNNLQISVHAIGDRANSYVLDMFKEIKDKNPSWDRRFRIEHAQHIRTEDIQRFKDIGVIASMQPYHAIDDGVWAEKRIGADRIKQMYPFRSFIDAGVKVCFGSDWVVATLNPLMGVYAAVTRRTLDDKNPDGWIPEQKISVEEAIECYTINNAYASFDEDRLGSIEEGKLADLVVLEEDILTIDPIKIKDVKVNMTIFDGEVVYKAE